MIGGIMRLRVVKGDITKLTVDAIVNAANSLMVMGGGVAGAIKRAGGADIEREAMEHAPVPVGGAVATGAGRLKAKYVIHVPTMERPAMRISLSNVKIAMDAAVRKALELGVTSLAIPALGTGVGGVDRCDAARAMIGVLKRYVDANVRIPNIVFVDINEEQVKCFREAIREILGLNVEIEYL